MEPFPFRIFFQSTFKYLKLLVQDFTLQLHVSSRFHVSGPQDPEINIQYKARHAVADFKPNAEWDLLPAMRRTWSDLLLD